MSNTHALVTSDGAVRVSLTEEVCTGCETRPALFPFDRMHCSIQLALDAPGTRLRPSSISGNGASTSMSLPRLQTNGVVSWTTCSAYQPTRRKLACTAVEDFVLPTETLNADDINASLAAFSMPASLSSAAATDCLRYDVCFRRILLYYAVVLLSPTGVVTILVLVLLITSPPSNVKLPTTLASVIICSMIAQFCCTLAPTRTLPVVVVYPVGLVAISLTSACVSLVLGRRDRVPLFRHRSSSYVVDEFYNSGDRTCEPEAITGRSSASYCGGGGNNAAKRWQPTDSSRGCAATTSGAPTSFVATIRSHRSNHSQDTFQQSATLPRTTGNCVGSRGITALPPPPIGAASPTAATDKSMTMPGGILLAPLAMPSDSLSVADHQFRRRRYITGNAPATHQPTDGYRDIPTSDHQDDDDSMRDAEADGECRDSDCGFVQNSSRSAGQLLQRKPASCAPPISTSSALAHSRHNSPALPADVVGDQTVNCSPLSNHSSAAAAKSNCRRPPKRKKSFASSSSSPWSSPASKSAEQLHRRARIERCVDMVLFVATILLFIGSVIATIIIAF